MKGRSGTTPTSTCASNGPAKPSWHAALTPGPDFDRVAALPDFLAQATQPDGRYTMLGDTLDLPAIDIPGTAAEFAATRGAAGPMPDRTAAVYDSGYLFARTGWGTTTPMTDERALSLRFGTQGDGHGHEDGGSLTLYGFGSRLLVDPGMWAYQPHDPERAWATSRSRARHGRRGRSHHGDRLGRCGAAAPQHHRSRTSWTAVLAEPVYAGVTMRRRVVFSRALGYAVVEDRAHRVGSARRTCGRQRAAAVAPPRATPGRPRTGRARGRAATAATSSSGSSRSGGRPGW